MQSLFLNFNGLTSACSDNKKCLKSSDQVGSLCVDKTMPMHWGWGVHFLGLIVKALSPASGQEKC